MRNLLEKLSKEKLIDFMAEYGKSDAKFVNAVNMRFSRPEFETELSKIENKIDSALGGASDYRNRDSWGYMYVNVSDIAAEIKQRVEQGHIKLAFAEIELLYRKLLENFEYQCECEISDEAENCLDMMAETAGKASLSEDKDYIFKRCIELSRLEDGKDYGAEYETQLLGIAAKFVTPENLAELEEALACFGSQGWWEEEFNLIRLEIIRRIKGEDAADSFIAENLQFPKIREIAFEKATSRGSYTEAERLCAGALSEDKRHYGISPWLYKLHSVHEMAGNTAKIAETSEKILLEGDLSYYDKLKSLLLEQAMWKKSYPELLHKCEMKLSYSKYMEILAKEKEHALLLEQVKKHAEQICRYGELLAEKYPIDTCAIFTEQINKEAESAYGRDSYREVCSRVTCFAKAGYKAEAAKMVSDFKLKYKRKPAFVDELKKYR
ncbi:MAG: hypothetical protein FWG71_03140 [Synergistaceae bacterium]|nr:hypothetical protein [Synergistaceae bacterium]